MSVLLLNNYVRIIGSTAAVYLFIVLAIRLFGKKELAQLSVVDMVFILLISNAVQNAMVGPDNSLSGGLVAALTLFLLNYILKYLQYRFPRMNKLIEGDAILLVFKGKVMDEQLRKAQISVDELLETIREHGVASVKEVDLAILETDGNISVLSHNYERRTVKHRKSHKIIQRTQE